MNKTCRLIAAIYLLAMTYTAAAPKLKIKPSLSISLNKRSVNTEIENKYYLGSLKTLISDYSTQPFGAVANNGSYFYASDKYLSPGLTYIDETFTLKKTGAALANASETDAITGDKLVTLLSSDDVTNLSEVTADGSNLIPLLQAETVETVSTLTFYSDLKASSDGIISEIATTVPTYSYITTGDNTFLKIDPSGSTTFSNSGNGLKKYYTRDPNKKYYLVIGNAETDNFKDLIAYDPTANNTNDSNRYTQLDYEYVEFYGVTLAIAMEYELTSSIFVNLQSDITTPIEKITHTGKFVTIKPEADISLKAGVSLGNENGSIGYLYGMTFDRFSASVKRFIYPVGDNNYLERQFTQVKKFATCQEIFANIRLTTQLDAHFGTVITGNDYHINLNGSEKRSPVTNQRFSAGFTMNY